MERFFPLFGVITDIISHTEYGKKRKSHLQYTL